MAALVADRGVAGASLPRGCQVRRASASPPPPPRNGVAARVAAGSVARRGRHAGRAARACWVRPPPRGEGRSAPGMPPGGCWGWSTATVLTRHAWAVSAEWRHHRHGEERAHAAQDREVRPGPPNAVACGN